MKNFFGVVFVYGLLWSGIQASWTLSEYDMTIRAYKAERNHAELRHRINGQASQICFFLANVITVGAGIGMTLASKKQSSDQA
jgi:hypothetical protein